MHPIRMGRPDLERCWRFIDGVYVRETENPPHDLITNLNSWFEFPMILRERPNR
jgi:hypothetical protein